MLIKCGLFSIHLNLIHSIAVAQPGILYFIADSTNDVRLHWRDGDGELYGDVYHLRDELKKVNRSVHCLMNGGMYEHGLVPQGLYIENGLMLQALDTATRQSGNFYMQPNGALLITKAGSMIVQTSKIDLSADIKFATQSGPMLLIDGKINGHFQENSTNTHYRNGVGHLSDGRLVFAISEKQINFYDFALFFKDLGCDNALYLDGFVSQAIAGKQEINPNRQRVAILVSVTTTNF